MRAILTFFLGVLTSCASTDLSNNNTNSPLVIDERHTYFTEKDFDACRIGTPEETWEYWNALLDDKDIENIKSTYYSDLIRFHRGWGTGIRNGLCLWKGGPLQTWFIERGVSHPDSMSQILIELYWAHLNECRPQVDDFARSDYPGNPDLLLCPSNLDVSVLNYVEMTSRTPAKNKVPIKFCLH